MPRSNSPHRHRRTSHGCGSRGSGVTASLGRCRPVAIANGITAAATAARTIYIYAITYQSSAQCMRMCCVSAGIRFWFFCSPDVVVPSHCKQKKNEYLRQRTSCATTSGSRSARQRDGRTETTTTKTLSPCDGVLGGVARTCSPVPFAHTHTHSHNTTKPAERTKI